MKKESFLSLFPVRKPIIGMVHLGALDGQRGFVSEKDVIAKARCDISAWQQGGIHGLILENWQESAIRPRVSRKRAASMQRVVCALAPDIHVPFGVNVLNNDYQTAYGIAAKSGASFIQLDTLVDVVVSDFTYNERAKAHPFVVDVDLAHLGRVARRRGLCGLPVLAGIHPKHYRMLDSAKTTEQSARELKHAGVAGIVVTKATGVAPLQRTFSLIRRVVNTPIGVGSGLTPDTAGVLLPYADFAIVGTFAKKDGITDNPVDVSRVYALMRAVYGITI